MRNYDFKEVLVFKPDEIFRIRRGKEGDVSQAWLEVKNQANLTILHLLGCGDFGLHGVLDTQGEEQGDEAPGQIANKAAKNKMKIGSA